MLFTERSLLTMLHGIVLGGGALMALAAALFAMGVLLRPVATSSGIDEDRLRGLSGLTVVIAVLLWVTVLSGTYIVFPPYRAAPPAGVAELAAFPRSLLLSKPDTAWLHAFAMEVKEHMPWIAVILATAVAFVALRAPRLLQADRRVRSMAVTLLGICFGLTAVAALLGTFINKVAPLE